MIHRWLFDLAGLAIVLTLIFVPFGYGGTEPWSRQIMNGALGAGFACWVAALLARQQRPCVPLITAVAAFLLMAIGWGMTLNARSAHNFEFWEYVPLVQRVGWLPGTFDVGASHHVMIRLSALLAAFMITCDLCWQRRWLEWLTATMAVAGTATAAFGIYQKIAPEPLAIWPVLKVPPTAFATFWYHGNAASFLNLTLALVIGRAVVAFRGGGGQIARAAWLLSAVIVLAGLALNVSKAGHAMALLMMAAYMAMLARRVPGIIVRHGWRQPLALAVLVLTALVAGALSLDWSASLVRWQEYIARGAADSRFQVASLCLGMTGQAGWFGFGPGAFDAVFQHHVADMGVSLGVRWKYAHNDYLQTLLEWGFIGTAVWICFWFIPLRAAWSFLATAFRWSLRGRSRPDSSGRDQAQANLPSRRMLCVGPGLALLGVFINAAFDFPLQIEGIQLYVVVIAGMLSASHLKHRVAAQPSHATRR